MKQSIHGKKALALLLAVLMIVSLLPVGALATTEETTGETPAAEASPVQDAPEGDAPAGDAPVQDAPAGDPTAAPTESGTPAEETPTAQTPAPEPTGETTPAPTEETPEAGEPSSAPEPEAEPSAEPEPEFDEGEDDSEEEVPLEPTPSPEGEEQTLVDVYSDFDVSFDWQEGTSGASVRVTLLRSKDGGGYEDAGDTRTVRADTSSESYHVLASDASGSTYAYKISVKGSSGFRAVASGRSVTVTAVAAPSTPVPETPAEEQLPDPETPEEDETDAVALINDIISAIVRLSSVEQVQGMDRASAEFAAAKAAYEAVLAQIMSLTDEQKLAVGSSMLDKVSALGAVFAAPAEEEDKDEFDASVPINITVHVSTDAPAINGRTVEVAMMQDGTVYATRNIKVGASAIFSNLPTVAPDGHKYTYSTLADTLTGYTIMYSGFDVAYKLVNPLTTTFSMNYSVNWVNCTAGESITVNMVKIAGNPLTSSIVATASATAPGAAAGTLTDNAFNAAENADYLIEAVSSLGGDYAVEYNSIAGGTGITVTYIGDKITVRGNIYWYGGSLPRPIVTINLFGASGGVEHVNTSNGDSYYAFTELPGSANQYWIQVPAVPGYNVTVHQKSIVGNTVVINITISGPSWNGFTLRFTVGWRDDYNKRARRPSATTVYLYRDGVYTGRSTEVTAEGGWTGYFDELEARDSAHYYKYSVRQDKVPYYVTTYSRVSYYRIHIINTYSTQRTQSPKVGDPLTLMTPAREAAYAFAAQRAEELRAQVVSASETTGTSIDFDTLKKTNRDVCAWLTLDGSEIDYPVVQGSNNSEYLAKLFSGEASGSGALFIDSNNRNNFTDRNTVIYGHNMNNGSMFAGLLDYKSQSFYNDHKTIKLYTPAASYEIEVFAAFFTDDAYASVSKRSFSGNSSFLSFVKTCINESDFQSDVAISSSDKLVTFVTCSDDYDDGTRYLVMGKLNKLS